MRVQPANAGYLVGQLRGLSRLRGFTDRLVERLVAGGQLPRAALDRPADNALVRRPEHHEAIARALERHLAASGEYSYTLDLSRQDKVIDPVEDFLFNTKSGHCQRFATALVLMLRSQGIPTQMVVGYRGCEGRGDGWYDVREDHAHAWVEVLVPAPTERRPHGALWDDAQAHPAVGGYAAVAGGPAAAILTLPTVGSDGDPARGWHPMRWVTLDPTPSGELAAAAGDDSLLAQARQKWEALLRTLVLAYNKESREAAAEAVEEWVTKKNGALYLLGGAAVLAGLWWARRYLARRAARPAPVGPDYLKRMLATLGRAGHAWTSGRTAREFATDAGAALRATARTEPVADVPARVVAAYYAERFGGRPLGGPDRDALNADLRRLELALA
jgi:hypothetical protein